ncbi:hypothetical protein RHSIM_Rhsim12G0097300 [Rhododendron simsii]|uniref:pyruvate decarboxylase n=1 Tax=Rhododendron simsii TaxID=118357 RepID=A0A834G2K9_RHOSS|nr:hypothetical protein RHSIM_Rhsim12G0097300 [Rhododendron simsii]
MLSSPESASTSLSNLQSTNGLLLDLVLATFNEVESGARYSDLDVLPFIPFYMIHETSLDCLVFCFQQYLHSGDTAVIAEMGDSWFNCQKLRLPENYMNFKCNMDPWGAILGYAHAVKDKSVITCIGDGSFQEEEERSLTTTEPPTDGDDHRRCWPTTAAGNHRRRQPPTHPFPFAHISVFCPHTTQTNRGSERRTGLEIERGRVLIELFAEVSLIVKINHLGKLGQHSMQEHAVGAMHFEVTHDPLPLGSPASSLLVRVKGFDLEPALRDLHLSAFERASPPLLICCQKVPPSQHPL